MNLMSGAKAAGYYVGLYYVALEPVELNIERVKRRLEKGGHDILEAIVRRRYQGWLQKLSSALRYANEALLIDNSDIEPREIFRLHAGGVVSFDVDRRNPLHWLFEGGVLEAYDLVRIGEMYRIRTPIQ